MTFQDIIAKAQQGFQNIGQNLQGGRLPSPFLPKQDPLEARRIELLNKRASLGEKQRGLQNQYDTRIQNTIDEGGYVPQSNPIVIGGSSQGTSVIPQSPTQVQASESIPERILDVGKFQGVSPTEIPLPSQEIQNLLWEFFPNEATQSAVALAGENAAFNPTAENLNNDGSIDYGLMQNNDRTLEELLSKQMFAKRLHEAGIFAPEDVNGDARKSIIASKVTRDYEDAPAFWGDTEGRPDWSSWYGWQNKGYNMFPDQSIEEVANNPSYFKLLERLAKQQ